MSQSNKGSWLLGALEYYLRRVASKFVEDNGGDFSKFFTDYYDFDNALNEVNRTGRERKLKELTKGQFFVSQSDCFNHGEIDSVFSRLLGLNFLCQS